MRANKMLFRFVLFKLANYQLFQTRSRAILTVNQTVSDIHVNVVKI